MFCKECGTRVEGNKFCNICGEKIEGNKSVDILSEFKSKYGIDEKEIRNLLYKYDGNKYRVEKYLKFRKKYLGIFILNIIFIVISSILGKLLLFTVAIILMQFLWVFKMIYINIGFRPIITMLLTLVIESIIIPIIIYFFLFSTVFKALLGV